MKEGGWSIVQFKCNFAPILANLRLMILENWKIRMKLKKWVGARV